MVKDSVVPPLDPRVNVDGSAQDCIGAVRVKLPLPVVGFATEVHPPRLMLKAPKTSVGPVYVADIVTEIICELETPTIEVAPGVPVNNKGTLTVTVPLT